MWCRERLLWNKEWNTVVFSGKSRFCLGKHDEPAGFDSYFAMDKLTQYLSGLTFNLIDVNLVDLQLKIVGWQIP